MKAARLVVLVVAVAAVGLAALLAGRGGEEAPPPALPKPVAQTLSRQLGALSLAVRSLADAGDTALPQTEEERAARRRVGINTVRFGVSSVTTPK